MCKKVYNFKTEDSFYRLFLNIQFVAFWSVYVYVREYI